MNNTASVLAGGLGGISPILLKLAIDLANSATTINALNISLLLAIGLFGFLGCVVIWVFRETDRKKAFVLGISLPSLLNVGVSHASKDRSSTMALGQPVYASALPISGRTLKVLLPDQVAKAQPLISFLLEGNRRAEQPWNANDTAIPVPSTATMFTVRCSLGSSVDIALPDAMDAAIVATVTTKKNPWFGFLYAVGVQSTPLLISVAVTATQPNLQLNSSPPAKLTTEHVLTFNGITVRKAGPGEKRWDFEIQVNGSIAWQIPTTTFEDGSTVKAATLIPKAQFSKPQGEGVIGVLVIGNTHHRMHRQRAATGTATLHADGSSSSQSVNVQAAHPSDGSFVFSFSLN